MFDMGLMDHICVFSPEHICSIIASLLRNSHGTQRQRLLSKFTENDHEKVRWLSVSNFIHHEAAADLETDGLWS